MNAQTIDYDTLRRQVDAHPFPLLFATISGAHLYGFPSADSDFDLRGAHRLPLEDVVGLSLGKETIDRTSVQDGLETDLVTHDVRKFFGLLLKKNGYVLEQLLSPLVVHTTPEHEELRAIANDCVTRHHAHHYFGFAGTQWRLFRKPIDERGELPKVKPLLYVYRVLLTGIHLMRTGQVEANLRKLNDAAKLPYLDDLIAKKLDGEEQARLDKADLDLHQREYNRLVAELKSASESSTLPERPTGRDALNDLLIRLRLASLDASSTIRSDLHKQKRYVWKVRCIDRESKEFFDRYLIFDPTRCQDLSEKDSVESLLQDITKRESLANHRRVFREVSADEVDSHMNGRDGEFFALSDYFEDDAGRQLNEVELVAELTGNPKPIVLGDVRSILRQAPSNMNSPDSWTVEDSNSYVHFLQVAGFLQKSRWLGQSTRLSKSGDGPYWLKNLDLNNTTVALVFIRQFLMKRDDIFRVAVQLYLSQIGDPAKIYWVNHELQNFESYLKSCQRQPPTPELADVTNEELIDVITYGTGLFHRNSNKNCEEQLSCLLGRCGRERLMFACDSACRLLLRSPFTVAPLLYAEFARWSNTGVCPRPTRVVTERLFDATEQKIG